MVEVYAYLCLWENNSFVLSGAGKWIELDGFENQFDRLLINNNFRYETILNVDETFYYFYWNLLWELHVTVIMYLNAAYFSKVLC